MLVNIAWKNYNVINIIFAKIAIKFKTFVYLILDVQYWFFETYKSDVWSLFSFVKNNYKTISMLLFN